MVTLQVHRNARPMPSSVRFSAPVDGRSQGAPGCAGNPLPASACHPSRGVGRTSSVPRAVTP